MFKYNFYFYILLLTILSPISLYFLKMILNELSIVETLFLCNIIITVIIGFIYYFNKDKKENLFKKLLEKPNIICLLLIISSVYVINKFTKSIIIKKENITKFKPILTAVNILITTILGYYFFNEQINARKCLSIFVITIGILIGM